VLMPKTNKEETVVVCLSGRGDKDVQMVSKRLEGLLCHV
jgi:tryptophan synthase beta chain